MKKKDRIKELENKNLNYQIHIDHLEKKMHELNILLDAVSHKCTFYQQQSDAQWMPYKEATKKDREQPRPLMKPTILSEI